MQQPADSPWIEAFVAGTHTDATGRKMTVTTDHLDELVSSYDPAKHEAPVVVGHPKTDDPALGWVAALKRDGDRLYYQERDVEPQFDEMREAGRYKKRSLSFYLPSSAGNPTPGKLHIRHVGWLGAMPPAVKGMADKVRPAAFADDDGEGVVEFNDMVVAQSAPRWVLGVIADAFDRLRDDTVEKHGAETADRIIPRWTINSIREAGLIRPSEVTNSPAFGEGDEDDITDPTDQPTPEEQAAMTQQAEDLKRAQEKLDADRAELDRQQAEFNERKAADDMAQADAKAAQVATDAAAFSDALVAGGQLLPKDAPRIQALYVAAAGIAEPLSFGEGDDAGTESALDIVKTTFAALPQQFDFSEKSGDAGEPLNLNDPTAIAKRAADFHEAERKAGRDISFATAVAHVTQGSK